MTISPLAGKPARRTCWSTWLGSSASTSRASRPGRSRAARQLRHERAPRLVAARVVHGSPHPRDHPGDLRLPARAAHRRPALPGQGHPRALGPAERTALEVLAANGVETVIQRDDGFTPTPVISRAILVLQPRSRGAPRRRHRRDAFPQSARGRRLQVQPAERRAGRHRRDALGPGPRQRSAAARQRRREADAARERACARRPRTARISSCPT